MLNSYFFFNLYKKHPRGLGEDPLLNCTSVQTISEYTLKRRKDGCHFDVSIAKEVPKTYLLMDVPGTTVMWKELT
jgi:hypothetical protein